MTLALEGIALHSPVGEPAEHAAFQATMREFQLKLVEGAITPGEILVFTGAIIQTIQDYNRKVERHFANQKKDLQDMVAILNGIVIQSWRGNENAVANLKAIEKQLKTTCEQDDIRVLKSRLQDCVSAVQAETERRSQQRDSVREFMRTQVANPVVRSATEGHGEDPATGLRQRSHARELLGLKIAGGFAGYSVPIVLNRLQAINDRFGRDVGDAYFLASAQAVAQALRPTDQVFRWSGPALLAILDRDGPADAVRGEVARWMVGKK